MFKKLPRWAQPLLVTLTCLLPALASAHPGSGIVADRFGQIYFVDMVSGVWKLDTRGALTHLPGPAFHWMAIDAVDRFAATRLPSSAGGDIERIGVKPTLLLASDFPIAMGPDGILYFPTHGAGTPMRILKMLPSGQTSVVATLPATPGRAPLRELNGLAAAADGSLYYTEEDAVRRISNEGRVTTVVEHVRCKSNDRPLLRGLDAGAGGTIYVAATGCGSVLRITPDGHVSEFFRLRDSWAPTGVVLLDGNVYALEFEHPDSDDRREMLPRVRRITPNGSSTIVGTVTHH